MPRKFAARAWEIDPFDSMPLEHMPHPPRRPEDDREQNEETKCGEDRHGAFNPTSYIILIVARLMKNPRPSWRLQVSPASVESQVNGPRDQREP